MMNNSSNVPGFFPQLNPQPAPQSFPTTFLNPSPNPLPIPSNAPPQVYPTATQPVIGQYAKYGDSENQTQKARAEIKAVLTNFINSLRSECPENAFKYMLYNKIPNNLPSIFDFEQIKRYYPYQINEEGKYECVDYNLWSNCMKYNPNSRIFYPYQLSSIKEMNSRIKNLDEKQTKIIKEYASIKNSLEENNENFEARVDEELKIIKTKKRLIKARMMKFAKRLTNYSIILGRDKREDEVEKDLGNKIKDLKNQICEGSEIKKKLEVISAFPSGIFKQNDEEKFEMTDKNRMEKNKRLVAELKQLLYSSFNELKRNIAIVGGIKEDLNYYKNNEHFK